MDCRTGCGACCIAPAIVMPYHGMPAGKPAGVRCVHLQDDYRCAIFDNPLRPAVCADFLAEPAICGNNAQEAMQILTQLEASSAPMPGLRESRSND